MKKSKMLRVAGGLILTIILCLGVVACGSDNQSSQQETNTSETVSDSDVEETTVEESVEEENDAENSEDSDFEDDDFDDSFGDVEIKESPDKYTWYVNNYVGQNLASFGYTSMGGDRMDEYGEGLLKIIPIAEDGSYIDIEDDDKLSEYMVTAQDLAPNTEIKFIFQTDSKGKEYDNLVDSQNYEEIVLLCKKVNGDSPSTPVKTELTAIDPSDRHNYPIRDYVGRNLMNCGYTSMGGDRLDEYDDVHIEFQFVTTDGSYINPEKEKELKKYYVTAQSVKPNKVMKVKYNKRNGEESYYSIKNQSIKVVKLKVAKVEK